MDKYSEQIFDFTPVNGRKVEAEFDEPAMTSDAGTLLLRELIASSPLVSDIAEILGDQRCQGRVTHSVEKILSQRIGQICSGYFHADDSDKLRDDPAMVLMSGGVPGEDALASQPTVSRLENRVDVRALLRIGYAFVDDYVRSFQGRRPKMVMLDMDPTAITVYGGQQLALFNGYEDEYCLMPFHVYDGLTGRLITTVVRPGKTPTAGEVLAVLKRIVKRLRRAWPKVQIALRADSHHTKPEVMDWMEAHGMAYVTGLSPNKRLDRQFSGLVENARRLHSQTWKETRLYRSAWYSADSWGGTCRRVICRVLVNANGVDTRYIVTSFEKARAKFLYETLYSDRGNAELMIKDHKLDLGSSHASCHAATANQFRLFLHSAAYTIMHRLRALLKGTELENARFSTLQLRLLKIAARVQIRKRSIRFHLPLEFPLKHIFAKLATAFVPMRA